MVIMNTNPKEIVMSPRSESGPIMAATVIVRCAGHTVFAQVDWSFGDPVVLPGPSGSWNEGCNMSGDVVFDGFESGNANIWGGAIP